MTTFHDDFRAMAASLPRRALPSPVFRAVEVPKPAADDRECLLCGGTESGRHPWHGYVGVCTCEVKS